MLKTIDTVVNYTCKSFTELTPGDKIIRQQSSTLSSLDFILSWEEERNKGSFPSLHLGFYLFLTREDPGYEIGLIFHIPVRNFCFPLILIYK